MSGTIAAPYYMSINNILQLFPNRHPAAILFDLDGTLVDSAPDIALAIDETMQDAGFPAPGETRTRDWIGNGSRVLVRRALAWASGQAMDQLDTSLEERVFEGFLAHYAHSNGVASRLYDGALNALQYWRQRAVPMAVVTNKPLQFVPPLLSVLGIENHFSILLGGECVVEKKPSPMPLLHACERLGVAAAHCVMVGDSGNDVLAARAAAMPVIGVRGGYNHGGVIEDNHPDLVIDSLEELIPPNQFP